jgi:hypothetical protein
MAALPDASILNSILAYNPMTGALRWLPRDRAMFGSDREFKRWNTRYAGQPAFTAVDTHGYRHGAIFGRLHLAHRVIWKMVTGQDAPDDIDHDDGNRRNNRWSNLKDRTRQQNACNQRLRSTNKSGVNGVHWDKAQQKWRAQIGHGNMLGSFDLLDAAVAARRAAEQALNYHPNHGRR